MPLTRSRLLPVSRSCLSFNGVNQYAVIGLQPNGAGTPFTVYGWSEITIEELIYPVWPKATNLFSDFSMIGDNHVDRVATHFYIHNLAVYSFIQVGFQVRRQDGTSVWYNTDIYAYRNSWVHVARRFTSAREFSVWVNGNRLYYVTIPSTEYTILEWNPDTATSPHRYRRFTLGANTAIGNYMTVRYGYVRIYSRALADEEILWNYYYPDNPVRNGLVLWLHWDSIDTANNMWYDKSGFGNHATLYNGPVKEDVLLPPKRVLSPTRIQSPTR